MPVDVRVPQLGESVSEAVIVRWLKQDGELVRADEPLLELETEKAAMEVVAEAAGRLHIGQAAGARVGAGAVVGRITEAATADGGAQTERAGVTREPRAAPAPPAQPAPVSPTPAAATPTAPATAAPSPAPPQGAPAASGGLAEPQVESPSRDEQPAEQPEPAGAPRPDRPGTGVRAPADNGSGRAVEPAPSQKPGPGGAEEPEVERVPMSELRRVIASRLVEVQRTAAILTTFNEVDLGQLLALRARHRERFRTRHGVDLGLVSLFGRAVVHGLREVPIVNARIEGGDIVYQRRVHLGIAVSTARGLVVPVVRDADTLPLAGLERAITDLAGRAREGRLGPGDLRGGTFTITNGGVFGSLLSTPILNPPQSGILGMHKIEQRPVALDGQVVIRPMMYLALSYDHRLVDGEQAVTFLVRVKEALEDPARMLLEV
jgi:2-oxoglutarate dehydrogenase E2 component (dihydrolipoamide succinyltransferase)